MDLNIPPPMSPAPELQLEQELAACSICLDSVLAASPGTRSVATLQCGHTFHLDCIGSAFNAKGIMQCPNCRHTENGNWLTANELQPSTDSDSHFAAVTRETFQVISGPLQGYNINRIRISSTSMEAHQLLSNLQPTVDGSNLLNSVFRNFELQSSSYHTTGMEGEPTAADLSNTQVFDESEPRNSEIEQNHLGATPMVDFVNRPTAPFGFELPRYDGSSQQRHSTQPTPGSGSSSVTPLRTSPAVTSRDHGRHRLMRGHVQQTVPQPATRSRPYTDPISRRNVRPRAASIASSIAASRAEDREPHDIYRAARAANLQNMVHNQQETASRRADQPNNLFGQWRSTAEPGTGSSQHNQENSGFPSGSTSELPPEFRSENGYYQSGPSNWRNPFL
ncbi:unnamed protein product [Urochloa decumbens]|uniref:RING-type domain-containing protein n=1 Tax=Urochloa decumbens TaxID=240449 RepID=A0ABC9EV95_9POAL